MKHRSEVERDQPLLCAFLQTALLSRKCSIYERTEKKGTLHIYMMIYSHCSYGEFYGSFLKKCIQSVMLPLHLCLVSY